MEIVFPIEFIVYGTPVSHQAKRAESREQWKQKVRDAARDFLGESRLASDGRISVCIYYFPSEQTAGDIDNMVKLILDACMGPVFVDDGQVERITVQKFEPDRVFNFSNPTPVLAAALDGDKPAVYVKIGDEPSEELL